jgi:ribosomal protein S18 acetylase RimI-like enzyme
LTKKKADDILYLKFSGKLQLNQVNYKGESELNNFSIITTKSFSGQLKDMETESFTIWFERSVSRQAQDRADANHTDVADEKKRLEKVIPQMLPEGMKTKGHIFKTIFDSLDQEIGFIWFAPMQESEADSILLMDNVVLEEFRGLGIGKQALKNMLSYLKTMGFTSVLLEVRKDNPAKFLYEKLGFKITSESNFRQMMKLRLNSHEIL